MTGSNDAPGAPSPVDEWVPYPDPIPDLVLQQLATQWLDAFRTAAVAKSGVSMSALFHEAAIIYGATKGGPIDWPLSHGFVFDHDSIQLRLSSPNCLVLARWRHPSPVLGGSTRHGHATFFLSAEVRADDEARRRFVATHAHFSEDHAS